jgi:hypothetical protein
MTRRNIIVLLLTLGCATTAFAASPKFTLGKNATQQVKVAGKNVLCGLVGNKWQPVVKVTGKIYRSNSKANTAYKKACSALLRKGAFTSLAKLPNLSQVAKVKAASKTKSIMDVSGTPPVLSDIGSMAISDLFWRSGVIDAFRAQTPSADQCGEFFLGASDGLSGGFLACTMTEDVGYAFEPILRSGSSLCYMQKFPVAVNGVQGAATVVSGELPDGAITQLFTVPKGSASRVIKVNPTTQGATEKHIFMKIFSAGENAVAGNQYHAKIWFCGKASESAPDNQVFSNEDISVSLSGFLKTQHIGSDQYGSFDAIVQGALTADGSTIGFDAAKDRTATVLYRSISDQNHFKAGMTIGADGLISQKFFNLYSGTESKKYMLAKVNGDSLQNLRFTEGAFSQTLGSELHSGAIEFRDSVYLSAPANALLDKVQSLSFDTDSFFSAIEDIGAVDPALSCDIAPDVEINLAMDSDVMTTVVEQCEANNKQTNNFCRENDVIKDIMEHYGQLCPIG